MPGEQTGVYSYKIKAVINRIKRNSSYFYFPQINHHFMCLNSHVHNALDICEQFALVIFLKHLNNAARAENIMKNFKVR